MPETLTAPRPAAILPLLSGAAIWGVGAALPATRVSSDQIAGRLGVAGGWIESRTGVTERRRAAPGERLADLAALAGRDALTRSGFPAEALDLVIVATSTADAAMPSAAPLVAGALGAVRAAAFDLDAACNGFLSALTVACGQIESGRAASALVVGADLMSRLVDPDDRRTAPLFGDGAGAVVLGASPVARIGPAVMRSDAHGASFIRASGGPGSLAMDGHETFKAAVERLAEVTLDALRVAGMTLRDVDLFVYHQANARILTAVADKLGLDESRVVNAIGTLGNTSAASIPLALSVAERDGRLADGTRVLLAAFGAGFTWGATTVEWGSGVVRGAAAKPARTAAAAGPGPGTATAERARLAAPAGPGPGAAAAGSDERAAREPDRGAAREPDRGAAAADPDPGAPHA